MKLSTQQIPSWIILCLCSSILFLLLGEMGQRMRALVDAGQYGEGLNAGVQHFVNSLAQKLSFSTDNFDKAPADATATSSPTTDQDTSKPAVQADPVTTPTSIDVLPT